MSVGHNPTGGEARPEASLSGASALRKSAPLKASSYRRTPRIAQPSLTGSVCCRPRASAASSRSIARADPARMYADVPDPYCYPGTTVLVNRLGFRDQVRLDAFEAEVSAERATQPLPVGALSYALYRAIHRHLFQDVYAWAGKIRSVRISKGESTFC